MALFQQPTPLRSLLLTALTPRQSLRTWNLRDAFFGRGRISAFTDSRRGSRDNSDPGPRILAKGVTNIGTYHTHAGMFEETDEIFYFFRKTSLKEPWGTKYPISELLINEY